MADPAVCFIAAPTAIARASQQRLIKRYGNVPAEQAEVIVALGGDGLMLESLHRYIATDVPIYGMNRGTVGFLMNRYREAGLLKRLKAAQRVDLHPLRMKARQIDGTQHEAIAINEVSMLRETRQAARLKITVDGTVRMPELMCDGVMVSSPAGSTAYNLSAHGPIIPLDAHLLALTPISPFRPRRWRGALLPSSAKISVEVMECTKRPVSAVADYTEIRDVKRVDVREDRSVTFTLLFDPEHNLEERILNEQFVP